MPLIIVIILGNNHAVLGQSHEGICATLRDMGLDLRGNGSTDRMYDEGDQNLAVG